MKKLLFSLVAAAVCMLSAHSAFAQDIILMTDSEVIEATVIEINDDQVVYKAYDNPDGPVYKISASKISKISIKFPSLFNNSKISIKFQNILSGPLVN